MKAKDKIGNVLDKDLRLMNGHRTGGNDRERFVSLENLEAVCRICLGLETNLLCDVNAMYC